MTPTIPSIETLKNQARELRRRLRGEGHELSHAQALEQVARRFGHHDWNTLRALAGNRILPAYQLGDLSTGRYLKQPFDGELISVSRLGDGRFRLTIKFDTPVDVVKFASFSAFRSRVTVVVDASGKTQAKTSDGHPQMILEL